jgi:hypothetical protein
MEQLLQHGLNALMLGGTYALLGIGLTLIFGIMRVVNFTHGELYAFGAYMMYALVMKAGVNFFVALGLAIVLGILLGALLELVLLSRLRARRYRYDDARHDRRVDRAAERRAARLDRRRRLDQQPVSCRAARAGAGLGGVEPGFRLRDGPVLIVRVL